MTDNIVKFTGKTTVDGNAKDVLLSVIEENPKNVFIACFDDENVSFYSNTSDGQSIIYALQLFMHQHFNGDFD